MIHFLRGATYPAPGRRTYPANQVEGWMAHRQDHWFLFDRLWLARYQGLQAHPHGIVPSTFPVYSRPIVNLAGDNAGGSVLRFWHEMNYRPGHFWTPILSGPPSILDLVLDRGEVVVCYQIDRLDERNGVPIRYDGHQLAPPRNNDEQTKFLEQITPYLSALTALLPDFTGPLSLRRMGPVVTSLRFSLTEEFSPFYLPLLDARDSNQLQPPPAGVTGEPGWRWVPIRPATVIPVPALQTLGDLYGADLEKLGKLDAEVVALRFDPGRSIKFQPTNDLVYQLGFVGDSVPAKADKAAQQMVELIRPIKKGKA